MSPQDSPEGPGEEYRVLFAPTYAALFSGAQVHHVTVVAHNSDAAKDLAKLQAQPSWGDPQLAIIHPPPSKRNCPACGMFVKITDFHDTCRECRNQQAWRVYSDAEESSLQIRGS